MIIYLLNIDLPGNQLPHDTQGNGDNAPPQRCEKTAGAARTVSVARAWRFQQQRGVG